MENGRFQDLLYINVDAQAADADGARPIGMGRLGLSAASDPSSYSRQPRAGGCF